jgi:hypothetical protein
MNALTVCVGFAGKPHIIDVAAPLICTTQSASEGVRVAALGKGAKLMNKIGVWLTHAAAANAMAVVNCASFRHESDKLLLGDHRQDNCDGQNNDDTRLDKHGAFAWPKGQAQAQPPERDVNCNNDVRTS